MLSKAIRDKIGDGAKIDCKTGAMLAITVKMVELFGYDGKSMDALETFADRAMGHEFRNLDEFASALPDLGPAQALVLKNRLHVLPATEPGSVQAAMANFVERFAVRYPDAIALWERALDRIASGEIANHAALARALPVYFQNTCLADGELTAASSRAFHGNGRKLQSLI
ncbi:MAG: hypothetical protein ABIA47_02825 [bacterium]